MQIFLDDEEVRVPDGWVWVTTVEELIEMVEREGDSVREISLDNDLGDGQTEGKKFVEWMEEKTEAGRTSWPLVHIHTRNTPAAIQMMAGLDKVRGIARRVAEAADRPTSQSTGFVLPIHFPDGHRYFYLSVTHPNEARQSGTLEGDIQEGEPIKVGNIDTVIWRVEQDTLDHKLLVVLEPHVRELSHSDVGPVMAYMTEAGWRERPELKDSYNDLTQATKLLSSFQLLEKRHDASGESDGDATAIRQSLLYPADGEE